MSSIRQIRESGELDHAVSALRGLGISVGRDLSLRNLEQSILKHGYQEAIERINIEIDPRKPPVTMPPGTRRG